MHYITTLLFVFEALLYIYLENQSVFEVSSVAKTL